MAASDITALLAAGAGLVAAFCWYLASRVPVKPVWEDDPKLNPKSMGMHNFGLVNALQAAFFHSSRKNAIAAMWTAVSVGLGAFSIIVSKWPLISN